MRTKPSKPLKQTMDAARTTASPMTGMVGIPSIAQANARLVREQQETNHLIGKFVELAEGVTTPRNLMETVTSLLANIATKAENGQPIDLMHINSVAAFLAGVEAMADALPSATDETKRTNTLRVLATAGLEGGQVNDATFPIVSLGARKEAQHKMYSQMLQAYTSSQTMGKPNGFPVVRAVRELQMKVDRAMRSGMAPRSMAQTAPSRQGTPP